ncbi:hypothetical protein ACNSTU_15880 [Aquisalimonas sp. APHAB1-3]|uniref:hypothetical protein n=1 Tax=Aquisalimonas sp. APHAB1-3 TaxID=3402080 RepID=UPI003AAF84DC
MDVNVLLVAVIAVGLFCTGIISPRLIPKKDNYFVFWGVAIILFYYFIVFPAVLILNNHGYVYSDWAPLLPNTLRDVVAYIGLSGVFFGSVALTVALGLATMAKEPHCYSEKRVEFRNRQEMERLWRRVGLSVFLIALLVLYLFAAAYGGVGGYLESARGIRTGRIEVDNPFSFLRPFMELFLVVGVILFGCLLQRFSFLTFLVFVASSFVYMMIMWSSGARLNLIIYPFVIFLALILHLRKTFLLAIATPAIAIALPFFVWAHSILFRTHDSGVIHLLASYLSYPAASTMGHLEAGTFRGMIDFLMMPMYVLPTSLHSDGFTTAFNYNTSLIREGGGAEHGGTIPVDLLTLGVMQGDPILGSMAVGVYWGGAILLISVLLRKIRHQPVRDSMAAAIILKVVLTGVIYADPSHFVRTNMPFIFLVLILVGLHFLRKCRSRKSELTP